MQQTPNYQYPIWEDNDVPTWLVGWNNTFTKVDSDLHNVQTQITEDKTNITGLEQQIATANDEINQLTSEVSDLQTTTSGHGGAIDNLNDQMAKTNANVAALGTKVDQFGEAVGTVYRGVLSANEVTLAITIGDFDNNSLVDVYSSVYGLNPATIELRAASGGQPNLCVTTWTAQSADVQVAIIIK